MAGFAQELPQELKGVAASKFCKPVEGTGSADGRLAIAVGFKSPEPVDWAKYKTELGYDIDPDNALLGNFLIDVRKDRALALLEGKHFGTRKTYNHESCGVAWSDKGNYLVEMQSWKWHTAHATLHHLAADGTVTSRLDLLKLAKGELSKVLQGKHKIDPAKINAGYASSLSEPEVDDEGHVALHATAEVPKSETDPSVSILIKFTARPDAKGVLQAEALEVKEAGE
jgi:hypothetical protein